MTERVCAVVVTCNRRQALAGCLDSLYRQTRPADEILVVDNASQDGTADLLRQQHPRVRTLSLAVNTGGAGGFHEGMKWAHQAGFDWLWLMDDDGTADPAALAELLGAAGRCQRPILGSLVVDAQDPARLAFRLRADWLTVADAMREARDGIVADRINPFNGTLIARAVVDRVGLVKKEMFLWGDEEEYILRAMTRNIAVGTAVAAVFRHPAEKGHLTRALFGWLGTVMVKPGGRSFVYYRNLGYLNARYRGLPAHLKALAKYTAYFLIDSAFDVRALAEFYRYYRDGASDRFALDPARRDETEAR